MAYFTPAELPDNKYYIFGQDGGKRLAEMFEVPFLGQLPITMSIREGGDMGTPALLNGDEISKNAIDKVAQQVARQISIRNANLDPTKVVEVLI
jgi:ATP-binding protein involved in chromosome partitioning